MGGIFFISLHDKNAMTESKSFKAIRDRRVIDINDPLDVGYVHHQFPWLSHREIVEAIKKYGPDRHRVETELEGAGKQSDSDRE